MEPNEWIRFLYKLESISHNATMDHFKAPVLYKHLGKGQKGLQKKGCGGLYTPLPDLDRKECANTPLHNFFTGLKNVRLEKVAKRLHQKYSATEDVNETKKLDLLERMLIDFVQRCTNFLTASTLMSSQKSSLLCLHITLSKFFGRRTSPLIEHRTNASLVDGYFWTKNSHCAMRQLGGWVHMKGLGPLWFLRKNDGQRVMFLRSYSLPRSSQFFNQRAGIVICSSFGLNSKF